ncbi:MAG: ABC transporter permease subunit [Leadbetterella sp.]|nr:ABC transporter permease subunit [Leadbetterella sp.]
MKKTIKYVVYDIIRNRFVIGYTILLLLLSISFFWFESDPNKGLLSLLNIILMVIPLVSVIFSTIHFYNSYEFIELLSAQPMSRRTIYFSQFLGLCFSLGMAFLIGVGLPTLIFDGSMRGLTLVSGGLLITLTFVAIAFLASVITKDKAKAIGVALAVWFYLCILYDGMVLMVLVNMADHPMEKASLLFSALNPMDLARILVLMQLDVSALMGITGAVFQNFFSSTWGVFISFVLLLLWVITPVFFGYRIFSKKDL